MGHSGKLAIFLDADYLGPVFWWSDQWFLQAIKWQWMGWRKRNRRNGFVKKSEIAPSGKTCSYPEKNMVRIYKIYW